MWSSEVFTGELCRFFQMPVNSSKMSGAENYFRVSSRFALSQQNICVTILKNINYKLPGVEKTRGDWARIEADNC
jgi:hypothetical protein